MGLLLKRFMQQAFDLHRKYLEKHLSNHIDMPTVNTAFKFSTIASLTKTYD